jgi:hypothetical protein
MQAALQQGDTIVTSPPRSRPHAGPRYGPGCDVRLTGRRWVFARQGAVRCTCSAGKEFLRQPWHNGRRCDQQGSAAALPRRRADLGNLSRRRRNQPGSGLRSFNMASRGSCRSSMGRTTATAGTSVSRASVHRPLSPRHALRHPGRKVRYGCRRGAREAPQAVEHAAPARGVILEMLTYRYRDTPLSVYQRRRSTAPG